MKFKYELTEDEPYAYGDKYATEGFLCSINSLEGAQSIVLQIKI